MDLYDELKTYEKPDFTVIERDLSEDPEVQKKEAFSQEDRFVDYSLETQQKYGGILMPFFYSERLSPTRPTKILDYDVTPLGLGVWKLTTLVGHLELNQNDTSYTREHSKGFDRYFLYRKDVDGFILLERKEMVEKALEPFKTLRARDDILTVLHTFEHVLYPRIIRGETALVTENRTVIDLYHYILYVVFNKISKTNYERISRTLSRFNKLDVYHQKVLFDRSVWVDEKGEIHHTIGEIQLGYQPSDLFRTRRDKKLLNVFLRTKRKEDETILVHLTSQHFPHDFERFKNTRK
ncbi:MAG: hypothetical protein WBV93_08780 [Anaerobacillus sp.]